MSEAGFPLSMSSEGECVTVVALHGGPGLVHRLSELGLRPGSELRVLQRQGGGLVVMRGGTRLALGGGMAQKVWVRRS